MTLMNTIPGGPHDAEWEMMANVVLQERGYLVVATSQPHSVGEVLEWIGEDETFLDHKTVIIAETSRSDMDQQRRKFAVGMTEVPKGFFFYRVIAE
jgi:hypothetical protein